MKRIIALLSIVLAAAMILAACSAGNQADNGAGTQFPGETPGALATAPIPAVTEPVSPTLSIESPTTAATSTTEVSQATSTPEVVATTVATSTQSAGETGNLRGAVILPPTGRTKATLLSALMQYQVVDKNGVVIGKVNDYIVNWCEAHLLDIVVTPDAALNVASGNQLVIPYEVVTLGGGSLDVDKEMITLNLDQTQLADMPSFDVTTLDLTNTAEWEPKVMDYWSPHVHLSLRADCLVSSPFDQGMTGTTTGTVTSTMTGTLSGTLTSTITSTTGTTTTMPAQNNQVSVVKVGLASNLLNAEVQTGNGTVTFGTIEDIVLQPESGLLQFAAVRMSTSGQANGKLVLVPIRALNIKFPEGQVSGKLIVVLLVDQNILDNAPSINAISEVETANGRGQAFQYWKQYVPLNENVSH